MEPLTPDMPLADMPFAFKFKAPSGRVHRFQVIASHGIEEFVESVSAKLGKEADTIGGPPTVDDGKLSVSGFAMSYLDDEGDSVSITTDQDLLEAIVLARHSHHEKVDLFVHDPSQPPVTVAAPQPDHGRHTPSGSIATSGARRRRGVVDESEDSDSDDDDEISTTRRRRRGNHRSEPEQVIAGVPNELLLPGAVAALAVVIIGVFSISRLTSSNR